MKLTLIGGGGVRTPLFTASAARRADSIGLTELCLMDIDEKRLRIFGGLSRLLIQRIGAQIKLTTTLSEQQALQGADFVVAAIRVGCEQGRAVDERVALDQGVLGQETTGPGGLAMAMRSIPAISRYAALLQHLNPQAWLFNFTNPAGLVTQALIEQGFERVVGICDGANAAQQALAGYYGIPAQSLRPEVFGLNHLSWTRRVMHDGLDLLPAALADEDLIRRSSQNLFGDELRKLVGMWLNEYLYYFYYAEQAVNAILEEEHTRGEEIAVLNQQLIEDLDRLDMQRAPEEALRRYFRYHFRRGATYMNYADPEGVTQAEADARFQNMLLEPDPEAGEGYAGVALDVIQGLLGETAIYTALNVPNQVESVKGKSGKAVISGLLPRDVVEVSCRVDLQGIHPLPVGELPQAQRSLMQAVKSYERLAVEAILKRSRKTAIQALMAHPLVVSYPRARALVDGYLHAHAAYIGEWHG